MVEKKAKERWSCSRIFGDSIGVELLSCLVRNIWVDGLTVMETWKNSRKDYLISNGEV